MERAEGTMAWLAGAGAGGGSGRRWMLVGKESEAGGEVWNQDKPSLHVSTSGSRP